MLVYVLKQNGQPFMPTSRFGKVRRLLKEGKARVVRREPFTIKLLYEPETDVVQGCYCGVDTGSKHVGVAVIGNDNVLYQSQTELRDDIKRKMERRKNYRQLRRCRKTRYRKCRFSNRRNSIRDDRLQPSVKHKVQAHIDEIEFCKKILPISEENLILEVSQFDTALMKNPSLMNEKVRHWGYQKGFNYGHSSRRKAVLHRDNYTCQCCGKKNCQLQTHHIIYRSHGGSDDENNMITLCKECHKGVHDGTVILNKKPKKMNLKHATHMSIIRGRLLKEYPSAVETFGFVTSENRNHLRLNKDHYIDACVIASGGLEFEQSDVIYYKRRLSKGEYQLTRRYGGKEFFCSGKILGFKSFDKIEYFGVKCFIGSRRNSGKATLVDIFRNTLDFSYLQKGCKSPKMKMLRRISSRKSVMVSSQFLTL